MEVLEIEQYASQIERWSAASKRIVKDESKIQEEVERNAVLLGQELGAGVFAMDDLRKGVRWANALDAEAVRLHGSDTSVGDEQQFERTARRVMHLAGRAALNEANRAWQLQTNSNVGRNQRRGFRRARR